MQYILHEGNRALAKWYTANNSHSVAAFILFYFIADFCTCAMNAAVYLIATFILLHMKQRSYTLFM